MIRLDEKEYKPIYLYRGAAVSFCGQTEENGRTEEELIKLLSEHTWFYEDVVVVPLTKEYVEWARKFWDGTDSMPARETYASQIGMDGLQELYRTYRVPANIKLYGIRISIMMLEKDIAREKFRFRLPRQKTARLKETLEMLTGTGTLLIPGIIMDPNAFIEGKEQMFRIGDQYFNHQISSFYTGLKESELLYHRTQEKQEFVPEVYRIMARSIGYDPDTVGNEPIGIMEMVLPMIASKKPSQGIMDALELQEYMESPIIRDEAITIPGHQELEADSVYSTVQYLIQSGIWQKEDRMCAQIHVGTQLIPYNSYRLEMMEVAKKMFGITMVSDYKD